MRNEKECVCSAPNCCDTEQRPASQPGSVASGTHCVCPTDLDLHVQHVDPTYLLSFNIIQVKEKFTLEHAMKAHKGSRRIAPFFL